LALELTSVAPYGSKSVEGHSRAVSLWFCEPLGLYPLRHPPTEQSVWLWRLSRGCNLNAI
jgi:hypothetical protein